MRSGRIEAAERPAQPDVARRIGLAQPPDCRSLFACACARCAAASGFLIFIACIALGVAAIGGVNSVARNQAESVADQGQTLLGGDLRFELNQREASAEECAFLDSLG
jgi:predicted lysophospholipase L1 biosynthesis ABC-type transport system permease subunit